MKYIVQLLFIVTSLNGILALVDENPCSRLPCKNGGTCIQLTGLYEGFKCQCKGEWKGLACDIENRADEIGFSRVRRPPENSESVKNSNENEFKRNVIQRNVSSNPLKWSQNEILKWFNQRNQFDQSVFTLLSQFNGAMLHELYILRDQAPEYYFKAMSSLQINFSMALRLSRELRTLFTNESK